MKIRIVIQHCSHFLNFQHICFLLKIIKRTSVYHIWCPWWLLLGDWQCLGAAPRESESLTLRVRPSSGPCLCNLWNKTEGYSWWQQSINKGILNYRHTHNIFNVLSKTEHFWYMYYEQSKIFHDIKNRAKYFLKNIEQEDHLNFTHEYFQIFTNCSNTLFEIILIQQIITCNKFSSLCQITALDLTLHFFSISNSKHTFNHFDGYHGNIFVLQNANSLRLDDSPKCTLTQYHAWSKRIKNIISLLYHT